MTTKAKSKHKYKKTRKKQLWGLVFRVLLILVWVASAVIAAQLIVGYLMLWILGRETFLQPVPTAIYSALSYILASAWIIFATPKITIKLRAKNKNSNNRYSANNKKTEAMMDRNDLGLRELPTWTDIGLAPVGFVIATLLAGVLLAIFSHYFPWFNATQVQDVGFNTYLVGFDRLVAFITLVMIAPIAEELIFRGWLYGKLRSMLSSEISDVASMVVSIFLVSLLFGIIHMQWNVGVNVFAMSIVLCGLREITGTIYAGILMHMIKNGVAFWVLYVLGIG